jgi:rhodanese-related sulfurtransferase
MKRFARDIAGGVVIIAAAAAVGLLHNAVRGQSLPLIQKIDPVVTSRHADPADSNQASGGAVGWVSLEGTPEGSVTAKDLKAAIDEGTVYVIDARSPEAFEDGHIAGAMNIPYDRLPEYYDQLTGLIPLDATVVCYCWSVTCDFSDQLATELKIIGYTDVSVFTAGWDRWQEAGYPTEGRKVEP